MMLCLGYYQVEPRGRFDVKFIVFHETYQRLAEKDIKTMFNAWDERFKP
jgi:hypothetical protein